MSDTPRVEAEVFTLSTEMAILMRELVGKGVIDKATAMKVFTQTAEKYEALEKEKPSKYARWAAEIAREHAADFDAAVED